MYVLRRGSAGNIHSAVVVGLTRLFEYWRSVQTAKVIVWWNSSVAVNRKAEGSSLC